MSIRNWLLFIFIFNVSFLIAKGENNTVAGEFKSYSYKVWELPKTASSSIENKPAKNTTKASPKAKISVLLEDDVTSPTAALTYTIGGVSVSEVKEDDVVTIIATFDEAMADSPVVQVLGSGVSSISATDMTKVSTTSYTYSWTVGTGDGTQTFALATGTDAEGNIITATPTSGATITVDNTAPNAVLTLTSGGFVVSSYNSYNSSNKLITATFSEAMADSPIVQIVGSGFRSIDASTMTKVNSSTYTYYWDINDYAGPSTQTFALATGTDVAGNLVVATPTSGDTITMNIDPTAALTYTIDGSSVGAVKQGDVVTITASFNERMMDSPVAQISGSGPNSITATDMNKVSETSYTYSWTVGTGVGTQNFALHNAKDRTWSLITATPTSGATITVYSTVPTASLVYAIGGSSVSTVKQGDEVTITATFSEAMTDSPVVQVSGSGVNSITASDMTKVSSTSYTYSWTVGTGYGTQTFALATGTDAGGNVITATPISGASITVINTIVPEITLVGDAVISLEFGAGYIDAGATALDGTDGDITENITIEGEVDINTVGEYTLTYNVINAAGNAATPTTRTVHVTANVWDGSADSDWNTPANWSLNSVPSTTAKIQVPKTGVTNFPTASTAVTINSAYIKSGATLIAQSTFEGTITYERILAAVNKWYLVSSPVSEQTIVDLISNHTFATGTEGRIGIATYNNSALGWDYLTLTSTGTLASGKGYSTRLDAAGNISFTGTMPITDIGISITKNTNGFNLVGNPYPSFIAANNNANTTNNLLKVNATDNDYLTEATIWLWNQATDSYDQINQAHNTHIAPGQGFFVRSNGNHTFSITEAMQSHQGTPTFQKSTNVRPEVKLILTNATKTRDADVFYIEGTTTGFDNGYDSSIFSGSSNSFDLYTEAVANGTGKKLGTQSLPNTDLESMVSPVGVKAAVNTEITFSAEVLNLPDGIKVFLEDRSTNTFTRLDEVNSEYKVTLTEGANGIGRFYMHTTSSVLNTTKINLKNISIYKTNPSTLRIVGLSQGKSTFKLFDILGRQVVHTTFESHGVHDITLPKLPAGIYIV